MANLAERAHTAVTPHLMPGETLRAVGYLRTGPIWATLFLSNLFQFAMNYWFAGVTNQRLILIHSKMLGSADSNQMHIVPLSNVQLKGDSLVVKLPDKEKPVLFDFDFGFKTLTGLDRGEFKAVFGSP